MSIYEEVPARLATLRHDLESLNRKVSDLSSLEYRIDTLESDARTTRGQIYELGEQSQITQNELADLHRQVLGTAAAVKKLTGTIAWMRRQFHTAEGTTPANLDHTTPAMKTLVQAIHRGHNSADQLLSDIQRASLETTLAQHARARQTRQSAIAQAMTASQLLATTDHRTPEFTQAAHTFRTARTRAHRENQFVRDSLDAVERAERALALDTGNRDTLIPWVRQGQAAEQKLRLQVRTRIGDAVAAGHLFPVWFSTVLGDSPDPEDTDGWIGLACDLVVYRITYGVTDPVVALCPDTGLGWTRQRRDQRDVLERRIRALT